MIKEKNIIRVIVMIGVIEVRVWIPSLIDKWNW